VVAVDKPFEKVKPGYRPPLSKGMFVQVVLRGKSQAPRVVIPRSAVRNGVVLIADDENRLRRRSVEVLFSQGEVSVISEGLEAGGRVVVSDLVPAVEGMLLQVKTDESLSAALAGQDAGS
jgi:multidrug efflux pump subunit AcrA (membrane-fusion protein)